MPDNAQQERRAFGYRVSSRRIALGLTREELAGQCDLSVNAIYALETGKSEAKASTVRELSIALGCSPQYLLFGEEFPQKENIADPLAALLLHARDTLDGKKLDAFIRQSRCLIETLAAL